MQVQVKNFRHQTFLNCPRSTVARSIQAPAALGFGISQQAFKKETNIGVAWVIPARATPTSKIPIKGSGSADEVRKVCIKRAGEFRPGLMLTHCTSTMPNSVCHDFVDTHAHIQR